MKIINSYLSCVLTASGANLNVKDRDAYQNGPVSEGRRILVNTKRRCLK